MNMAVIPIISQVPQECTDGPSVIFCKMDTKVFYILNLKIYILYLKIIPKKIIEYNYSYALRLGEPHSLSIFKFPNLTDLFYQSKLDPLLVLQIKLLFENCNYH